MSRKQLLLALEKCGPMEALLMPPNKPYAFAIYKTIEESKKAYAILNGKEIIDDLGQKIILYLNFVEKGTLKLLTFCVSFLLMESLSIILCVYVYTYMCWCVCVHVCGMLAYAVPVEVKG